LVRLALRILTCRYARAVQDDPAAGRAIGLDAENRQHEFRSLGPRADVLIVLLAATVVATAIRLVVPMLDPDSPAISVELDVRPFVVASRILMLFTAIAFLAWFRGARINAEGSGWHQRFARGWTFWGWIVPVVNLWIPLRVMDDIWQASFPRRPRGWGGQAGSCRRRCWR
jgi:hypothetical protein